MKIGLDVGSTTIKTIVLDDGGRIVYSAYERHFSQITAKTVEALVKVRDVFSESTPFSLVISGSAGMGMAESCSVDFVQEVYATKVAAEKKAPDTDVIIELGGEDAKIIFLQGAMEARMNGSCAGGTGAFIDQMATLLGITPDEMNDYAGESTKRYTIASRCGVFAKSDIQPLINQGADKRDISASIFSAVVNQTIGGLAQGRAIKGNVLYLGGPLTFMPELQKSFDEALSLKGICPENSLYFVALGAALCAKGRVELGDVIEKLSRYESVNEFHTLPALFENQEEYEAFQARHAKADVAYGRLEGYKGRTWIGIDAGSTTVKAVVIGENREILDSTYLSNSGNPVPIVREYLSGVYERCPDIRIAGSCVTGYGEDIIKNAFSIDQGLVETMAHLRAAQEFMPDVEFIIDIGGQDTKIIQIQQGAVSDFLMNDKCSAGTGRFLEIMANTLAVRPEELCQMAAQGGGASISSMCTVFAESEVISLIGRGEKRENIAFAVVDSIVKKVSSQAGRMAGGQGAVCLTGGLCGYPYLRQSLSDALGCEVRTAEEGRYAGAVGAALCALALEKQRSAEK